ncbi:MAG: YheT family hydrolase [Nitrospiria bacterium]
MKKDARQNGFVSPWWCRNGHQQTVWRSFFGETPALPLVRERWETPDDDFLDLDFLTPNPESADADGLPTLLCLHGLEGSSRSKYSLGMLRAAGRMGWRGAALNFRSCSGEINWQPRFYHSGETTDLDWVVRRLEARWPESPLFVVGFSLGGNVLLKWLGERGAEAGDLIRASAVVSAPFDLGVAARRIDAIFGRLYGRNFLPSLKQKMLEKSKVFPDLIDADAVRRITAYIRFEDEIFAPVHGFKDAEDYWAQCSARYFLKGIRVPTRVIHAADDPFLPGASLPMKEARASQALSFSISEHGGHVGFVHGCWPWRAAYWAEPQITRFFSRFVS